MVKKKKQRNAHKIARTMAATLVLGNTVLTPISTFAATNSNLDVVESLSVAENWDNLQKENEEAVLPNAPQDSEINSDIASKAGVHMRFRGRSNLSFLVGTTVTREDILNISRPRYVKNAAFLNYPKSESKWRANLTGLDTNKVGRYSIPIDFNGVASGHAGNGNLAGIYGYVTVNMVDRESNDSDITFANQTIVLTPTNEFDDDIKKVINPSTSYRHVDDDSKSTESGNDVTWNDFDWDISELDLTTPGTYTVPISVNKVKMNINGDRQQYAKGTAEVTVVIVDEEVAEDAAPITVNYADEDGKKLTDSEKLTGK